MQFNLSFRSLAPAQSNVEEAKLPEANRSPGYLSIWTSPALPAVAALVVIQVCVGILFKSVQVHDTYVFSPSSLNCTGELLKFFVSGCLYWFTQRRNAVETPGGLSAKGSSYIPVRSVELPNDEESAPFSWNGESHDSIMESKPVHHRSPLGGLRTHGLVFVFSNLTQIIGTDMIHGFIHLALLYALLNNLSFVLYKIADPGTIHLLKSSSTIATAMIMFISFGTIMNSSQWIAIALQVCGLVITQYRSQGGGLLPWDAYGLLTLHIGVGSFAGVYNCSLYKDLNASVHVGNMILYAAGTMINLLIHIFLAFTNDAEPGFFVGYDIFGTWMMLISGAVVSLAMTAVYKYADAVIRSMATSVATSILIYLSHVVYLVELPFVVLPGTIVVFLASWLYTKETIAGGMTENSRSSQSNECKAQNDKASQSSTGRLHLYFTILYSLVAICIVTGITLWKR